MKPTFREPSQSLSSRVWYVVWHHSPDNEDQDDSRNVGLIYTSDMAGCPRRLYQILSQRKLLNIKQHYKLYSSMFWWVKHDISVKKACMKFRILTKFAEMWNRERESSKIQSNETIQTYGWANTKLRQRNMNNKRHQSQMQTIKMKFFKVLTWKEMCPFTGRAIVL
jgi:hypothetical protein